MRPLSLLEARVLGVLVEKAQTVPDSYPLSLNALVAGCNQKSARDPVINATEAEVQVAVDALKSLSLVFESSGSRVARYEHNVGRVLATRALTAEVHFLQPVVFDPEGGRRRMAETARAEIAKVLGIAA